MKTILLIVSAISLILFGAYQFKGEQQGVEHLERFQSWKQQHGKLYGETEEQFRLQTYMENLKLIETHNADLTQTYEMGENQFMDLTNEEFVGLYLSAIPQIDFEQIAIIDEVDQPIPNAVDWRNYTKVKEQGQCASGWAFSITGSVEAFYYIRGGQQLIDLSEQQLVDCESYSRGCSGGSNSYAFGYVQAYGIATRATYPYVAYQQVCRQQGGPYGINGYQQLTTTTALQQALVNLPVSVGVDAANWQLYKSGVFSNCGTSVNHFALNVGFENTGIWLIKNSWGLNWGEYGHIRLSPGNTCGVASMAYQNV